MLPKEVESIISAHKGHIVSLDNKTHKVRIRGADRIESLKNGLAVHNFHLKLHKRGDDASEYYVYYSPSKIWTSIIVIGVVFLAITMFILWFRSSKS